MPPRQGRALGTCECPQAHRTCSAAAGGSQCVEVGSARRRNRCTAGWAAAPPEGSSTSRPIIGPHAERVHRLQPTTPPRRWHSEIMSSSKRLLSRTRPLSGLTAPRGRLRALELPGHRWGGKAHRSEDFATSLTPAPACAVSHWRLPIRPEEAALTAMLVGRCEHAGQ